jgi:hypothetical protein
MMDVTHVDLDAHVTQHVHAETGLQCAASPDCCRGVVKARHSSKSTQVPPKHASMAFSMGDFQRAPSALPGGRVRRTSLRTQGSALRTHVWFVSRALMQELQSRR